jgi:phosphohistidine phosphatase
MIRLVLIRHAKSSWDVPRLPDRERSLNDRGRRDAPRMAAWLKTRGFVPDHVLVSSARRTRETWALLAEMLGPVPADFVDAIYEAEPEALFRAIRAAPDAPTLGLVGHNPGVGATARHVLADPPGDPVFARYPTCATAIIAFDATSWAEIGWGTGRLEAFVTPKTLPDA